MGPASYPSRRGAAKPAATRPAGFARRRAYLTVAAIAFLSLPTLVYPIGWDQSVYGYVAHAITLGLAPYRDAWAHNAPGGYYLYALSFMLLGESVRTVYLLSLSGTLLGTFASFHIGRRLIGGWGGVLAGLFFGITCVLAVDFMHYAEPELFMGAASASAVLAVLKGLEWVQGGGEHGRLPAVLLVLGAGVLAGVAVLFKPTALAFVAVPGVMILGAQPASKGDRWLLAVSLAGGLAAALLFPLFYFSRTGILGDLWQAVFGFNGAYFGSGRTLGGLASTAIYGAATHLHLGFIVPLSAVGCWAGLRERVKGWGIVVIWTALALGIVVLQFRFYPYHWLYAVPPMSVAAALGVTRLRSLPMPRLRLAIILVCMAMYGLVFGLQQVQRFGRDIPYFFGWTSRLTFLMGFDHDGSPFFATHPAADEGVGAFLKSQMGPEDRLLAWNRPVVQFLSGGLSPARYAHIYPLVVNREGAAEEAIGRFLEEVRAGPPEFLVIPAGDDAVMLRYGAQPAATALREIQLLADSEYEVVKVEGDLTVYRRK